MPALGPGVSDRHQVGPTTLPAALQEASGQLRVPLCRLSPAALPSPSFPSRASPRCPTALAGPMTLQSAPSVLCRRRRQAAPLRLRAVLPLARQPVRLFPRARSRPRPGT